MKRGALLRTLSQHQAIRHSGFGSHFRSAFQSAVTAPASPEPQLSTGSSRTTSGEEDPYDVVIVGGGMVGAAVGCGLASSHLTRSLRVAIVDGNPKTKESHKRSPGADVVPDSRVSAITPATVRFLKDVDAWETVLENRHAPFKSMQVWDYSGRGFTRYDAADVGADVLGYVVENDVLVSALTSALQRSAFAEFICPAQVEGVRFPSQQADNWAQVLLEDGRTLQSRLVVGADGGRSKIRDMAGIKTAGWNYPQMALICTVKVSNSHSTAWQRFLPTGPLALLPMGGEYSNVVWSTSPERAKELKAMSSEDFVLATNRALIVDYGSFPDTQLARDIAGEWLSPLFGEHPPSAVEPFHVPPGVTECLTPRLMFPLSLKHSKNYVANRVALVGDAAHNVHPLAGQGVNLGFGDAACLVKILNEGMMTGAQVGELPMLKKYERKRMFSNVPMMAVLDGLQRVFLADFLPVNLGRALGFSAANYLGPLKKQIISFAMGS